MSLEFAVDYDHKLSALMRKAMLDEKYKFYFYSSYFRYDTDVPKDSLSGEDLKQFKAVHQNDESLKFTSTLYLWTEKGAWLHAKSLNTDEAWDAYETLVDEYYVIKNQVMPKSQSEIILMLAQQNVDIERKQLEIENTQKQQRIELDTIKIKQDNIVEIVSLNSDGWRDKIKAILKNVAKNKGGEYGNTYNESYKALEDRAKCKLNIRLNNRKKDLALSGASKTVQKNFNKLDVIAEDKKLTEIYLAVVKDLAIKYSVNIDELSFN